MKDTGCRGLEEALRTEDPRLLAAMEEHGRTCEACRRELSEWNALRVAAPSLRKSWESSRLWARIEQGLAEDSSKSRASSGTPPAVPPPVPRSPARWLPIAAMVALFSIATAGLWVFRNSGGREPLTNGWQSTRRPLLTDQAVDEVDAAEKTYVASIEKLSKLAEPRLADAASPLMLNYKEKLQLLDSAIADLKSSIDQNRYNTHLRKELIAMYQEKQRTLESVTSLMKIEVKS
ncbi:MAG TPA: hypothetical protein VGO79_04215 [Thermoanaerobaculia bacterium]|jgi:hypothetical protein